MLTTSHEVGPVTRPPTLPFTDEETGAWKDEEICPSSYNQKWQAILFYVLTEAKKGGEKKDIHIFLRVYFPSFRPSSFSYHAGYKDNLGEREDSI